MLYFAYGSNMSHKRLVARTASARFHAVATLHQHALKFHKIGQDGSGKCDVVSNTREQSSVHGVIYQISAADKQLLDRYEGLGKGYQEKISTVSTMDGQHLEVILYQAIQTDSSIKPFHWYKQHVLQGAMENNLPADYISQIQQFESITDPDSKRHNRETDIYHKES